MFDGAGFVRGVLRKRLAARLRQHYPEIEVTTGSTDPLGFDLVVNATPLGMKEGYPMPLEVSRLSARTFVVKLVMKTETTALLAEAILRGCNVRVGSDMLFEQTPAYLEFFGRPSTSADEHRSLATLQYQ